MSGYVRPHLRPEWMPEKAQTRLMRVARATGYLDGRALRAGGSASLELSVEFCRQSESLCKIGAEWNALVESEYMWGHDMALNNF